MAKNNWSEVILRDLVDIKHGFAFQGEFFTDEETQDILLTPGNFAIGGGYKGDKLKYYFGETPEEYVLSSDDLIVTMTDLSKNMDTLGYSALVPAESNKRFLHNQRLGKVIIRDEKRIDKFFLYYLLRTNDYRNEVKASASGSVIKHTSPDRIRNYRFFLPPTPEQRAIARILGALDDKIELNHRMNRTLESMARAVFRQWFVENEEVSKWDIAQIGDITDVIDCLHSKKPERQETGKPLLQLSNILENGLLDTTNSYPITEKDYNFWISRIEASPGDCVITNVGRVGAVAQIPEGFKAALGRNMTAVRCKKEYPYPTFLIECLMSDAMRQEINNKTDTGTILDALNVKNIPLLQFAMPHHKLLQEFEKTVRPIRAKMEHNLKESRTLASLRDSLLPKLMRGEVRVSGL